MAYRRRHAPTQPILVQLWARTLSVVTLGAVSDVTTDVWVALRVFVSLTRHLCGVSTPGQVLEQREKENLRATRHQIHASDIGWEDASGGMPTQGHSGVGTALLWNVHHVACYHRLATAPL